MFRDHYVEVCETDSGTQCTWETVSDVIGTAALPVLTSADVVQIGSAVTVVLVIAWGAGLLMRMLLQSAGRGPR